MSAPPAAARPLPRNRLRIDVWGDVVCPFCWIGKRRLEDAVRKLGLGSEVEIVHRAFELDPAVQGSRPLAEYLAARFGGPAQARAMMEHATRLAASVGLAFDMPRAVHAPTFDAHRLALHAQARGLGPSMVERLMRAHFSEGLDVSERATLARLASAVGLDAKEAEDALASGAWADEVRADEAQARAFGIRGVPFFVLGGRYALSGAQPAEVFEEALRAALGPA